MSLITQDIQGTLISPPLSEKAKFFALSDGDWIEKIVFDAATAFKECKYSYVEVFDADGNPLMAYRYFDKGELETDKEFEGYAYD